MTGRDRVIHEDHDTDVISAFEADLPAVEPSVSGLARMIRQYAPAAAAFIIVLVVWEGVIRALGVQSFIMPKPTEILDSFFGKAGVIWVAGYHTLQETLGGFFVGGSLGLLAAFATVRWVGVREGLMPFAIAANSVPIVALAPIMNRWFSLTSPVSKMAVVAVIVFFPVLINTARGLTEVDPAELELMRSFAAKPREILLRVRIPNALPYFFSALKIASALSLIGAIVAEYFGGPQDVLGQYIINRANLLQIPDAWAGILVASIMGITFYVLIITTERLVMPWHVSLRPADEG